MLSKKAQHRYALIPAEYKIVGLVFFLLCISISPIRYFFVFIVAFFFVISLMWLLRINFFRLSSFLIFGIPFFAFAILLPFISDGNDIPFLSLSKNGLLSTITIIIKVSLSLLSSGIFISSVSRDEIVYGVQRLPLPRLVREISFFMHMYITIITAEYKRMRTSLVSRGYQVKKIKSLPVLAKLPGMLFIRSLEKAERFQIALLSRCYDGTLHTVKRPIVITELFYTMLPALTLFTILSIHWIML